MKRKCKTCNWLRSKMKFGDKRFFCRFKGCLQDPENTVCDDWGEISGDRKETIEDYGGRKNG